MKNNRLIISLTVAGVLAIGAISASAVQSSYTAQGVYGCISPAGKNIAFLQPTEHSCPSGWSPISWASEGPVGATGPQGLQGPKGDPGYSYDEALASVDDPNSAAQALVFGKKLCIGPGFQTVTSGNEVYCSKKISDSKHFNILSVVGGISGSSYAEARNLYAVPGECPTTYSGFYALQTNPNVKALLISDQKPVKVELPSTTSCIFLWGDMSYGVTWAPTQIIYSTD
jgi:hypothetical protein